MSSAPESPVRPPEAAPLRERLFAIDLRSLAVFRIAIGAILTFDLANKATLSTALYSDEGLLPRRLVLYDPYPGIYQWSGEPGIVLAFFLVATLAAIAFTVGFRTRVAGALLWVNMLSLWWRNPGYLNGWDVLFIQLLFWCLFLPLGAMWSVDARRSGPPRARRVLSPATIGLCLQMPAVYFFSVFHKIGGDAGWTDGTAVALAVSYENWAQPVGLFLLEHLPLATVALSWGTLVFEGLGPLLLFSPWRTALLRILTLIGFAGFQLGLGVSIQLWLFPWASTAALLPLLPGIVWKDDPTLPDRSDGFLPGHPLLARAAVIIPIAALGYMAFSNIERQIEWRPPQLVNRFGRLVGWNQGWAMYSSRGADMKAIVNVATVDGREFRLDDGGLTVRWEPIAALAQTYRGRTYLERVINWRYAQELRGMSRWICRTHARREGTRLAWVEIQRWRREVEPFGVPPAPKVVPLSRYQCATGRIEPLFTRRR